jgi:nicotinate-nucleotide pyrophosphorylase (carboxylating)
MGIADPFPLAVRDAVSRALAEDLVPLGDLSAALVPAGATASATIVPRVGGVLAGSACATEAFAQVDPTIRVAWRRADGDQILAEDTLATVQGPLAGILTAERTALNFLCHLSGIATLTRRFVDAAAAGGRARIWDTRKTIPGLRTLEKAAVRAGGAANHRGNLSDWVMLKDNHLTELRLDEAVEAAHRAWPGRLVHVEVTTPAELAMALGAHADAILLDNNTPDQAKAAVDFVESWVEGHGTPRPLLECSGGITLKTVGEYAATGVDFLSTSQITQSAPALDIGLDI